MEKNCTNEKIKERINDNLSVICSAHKDEPIVYDGIVGETCDGIAFLLKETTKNGYEKHKAEYGEAYPYEFAPVEKDNLSCEAWDFITTTRRTIDNPDQRIESIWPVLCYWLEAYNNNNISFADLEKKYEKGYEKVQYDILKNTALVNLKKTAGESTSDDGILKKAAKEYGGLIKKDLEEIAPKYVVCCGTFDIIKDNIFTGCKSDTLSCGAQYFEYTSENGKKMTFVEFVHPGCRVKKQVTYAYAKAVFSELKGKCRNE